MPSYYYSIIYKNQNNCNYFRIKYGKIVFFKKLNTVLLVKLKQTKKQKRVIEKRADLGHFQVYLKKKKGRKKKVDKTKL